MGRRFKGFYFRPSADTDVSSNIKECITTIDDAQNQLPNKVANSFCYLAYRCLDGSYRDVDYVIGSFQQVFSIVDAMPHDHIRARWLVAVITAHTYLSGIMRGPDAIDIAVLDRALDIHLLMPPEGWQRSMVNSLACHLVRALLAKRAGDVDAHHEAIFSGIEVYRRVLPTYQFIDDSSDIVYETYDAAAIFGCLIETGRKTQFPVRYLWQNGFSMQTLPNGPLRDLVMVLQ